MPRIPHQMLRVLAPSLLAFLVQAGGAFQARDAAPPNVVLVIADDVGWSDVWPAVPTPNVESLASAGITFRRAYAMPNCITSRYATFLGRMGRREAVGTDYKSYLPPGEKVASMAEVFREAGYATAAFGKWHLPADPTRHASVVDSGFQHLRAGSVANLKGRGGKGYRLWQRIDNGEVAITRDYPTTAVREEFSRWWEEEEGPKFAWVAFHAPHQPLHDPPPEALPEIYERPAGVKRLRAQYEAMVASVDHALGSMLELIDLDDTIVCFFGDNGTPPIARSSENDRGRLKGTSFEGGVRVPLILAGAGLDRGRTSQALVHVMDLMPTLAERVGAELPEGAAVDGVSFAGHLLDEASPATRGHLFVERYEQSSPGDSDLAVITTRYKLRRTTRSHRTHESLYDLDADPSERRPLDTSLEKHAGTARRLGALLDALPPRR